MTLCRQCQRELPADASGGTCPACLLGFARGAAPTLPHGAATAEGAQREPAPPTLEELNRRLPQYRFEELIGSGGMGTVYKAVQLNLERQVAIKVMSPNLAQDPSFAERFAREARLLARLNHHHIVNVYDFGQSGALFYLVMEFVDGVNLRQALRGGQLTAAQALAIVPQVCEALQFAHDEGVIHRDIKPENILLDRRGRVKIADFGLAKLTGTDQRSWTLTGSRQVLGTWNYMAPEQMERPQTVDHRADIYSLGVVLYELLTGELPLGRFQLPGEKHAGWAPLDQVVVRTLEKQPDRRFQQASEFKTAVETACSNSGFRPLGPSAPTPAMAAGSPTTPAATSGGERMYRVPFTIENPAHGLTVIHGVLKSSPQGLLVDYVKRETMFGNQMGEPSLYEITWDNLLKVDLEEGWLNPSLVIYLDSPRDLPGLFTESPGVVRIRVKSADLQDAHGLTNHARSRLQQPLLPPFEKKPSEEIALAKSRLRLPAAGIMGAALINLMVLPFLLFAFSQIPQPNPSREIVQIDKTLAIASERSTTVVSPASPPLNEGVVVTVPPETEIDSWSANRGLQIVAATLWFGVGILLLTGSIQMFAVRSWGWCLVTAIIAIIPFHPGFILGIPSGIWAIVQLSGFRNRRQFLQNGFE